MGAKVVKSKHRRSSSSKKGSRQQIQRIYLVVEGATEVAYFTRLNELGIFPNCTFKVKEGGVEEFKSAKKQNYENKHVYLILDVDNLDSQNLDRGKKIGELYNNKNYTSHIFFTNYSFETFLINHFESFTRCVTNKKQYNIYMKSLFGIESWSVNKHENNRKRIMDKITKDNFSVAIENCKKLYNEDIFHNPNTNIHLLFEIIKKVQEKLS